MSVSAIDGTLESVTVKRKTGKIWRIGDLSIRKADGANETIVGVAVVTPEVGAALQPGTTGRFYLYKAIDHKGIHAIRPASGPLVAKFPSTNETLMAILFVINVIVVIGLSAVAERPSWLAIALIPFTGTLFFLYRATRVEAEKQVAADG